MPRNSLVNGKTAPDSFGTQLDETAYPMLMADELHLTDAVALRRSHQARRELRREPRPRVRRRSAGRSRTATRPRRSRPRSPGSSPPPTSPTPITIPVSAAVWRGVADDYQRSIKGWTVTTNGPLAPRYFIRLSKTGDPNAAISYNVGNGGPTLDQRSVIDAGLPRARAARRAVRERPGHPRLAARSSTRRSGSNTASGFGWHRYNGDGYGDRASDGRPWAPSGSRHRAPLAGAVVGARRAVAADRRRDRRSRPCSTAWTSSRAASASSPSRTGRRANLAASPFGTPPDIASIGFVNGEPAGSASPLNWSAASFVRLFADIGAGRLVDRPREHVPALRRAHAGNDAADGHEPGRPERRERLAGHRDRHDGAGQRGLRHGHEHGRELGHDDERVDDRGRGPARSASPSS